MNCMHVEFININILSIFLAGTFTHMQNYATVTLTQALVHVYTALRHNSGHIIDLPSAHGIACSTIKMSVPVASVSLLQTLQRPYSSIADSLIAKVVWL